MYMFDVATLRLKRLYHIVICYEITYSSTGIYSGVTVSYPLSLSKLSL